MFFSEGVGIAELPEECRQCPRQDPDFCSRPRLAFEGSSIGEGGGTQRAHNRKIRFSPVRYLNLLDLYSLETLAEWTGKAAGES
jgi:hypothetical protein